MTLAEKIQSIQLKHHKGEDVIEMAKDIYHFFNRLEGFEVLEIDRTNDTTCLVRASVQCTIADPFFNILVIHTWMSDLAFDNEWHTFTQTSEGVLFQFLTWEDDFISGEILFERVKAEINML